MATIPASATFGSYQPLTGQNQGLTVAPGAVAASQCYPTNYGFYRYASTGPARLNIPTAYAQAELPLQLARYNAPRGLLPTGSPPYKSLYGFYAFGGA